MPNLVAELDAVLPQTQCTECTYDGCLPYATAIAKGDRIDRCIPGGTKTLTDIANILKKDPSIYLDAMQKKQSQQYIVKIEEDNCIGCAKCITACPVDAIIGTRKKMHTISAER